MELVIVPRVQELREGEHSECFCTLAFPQPRPVRFVLYLHDSDSIVVENSRDVFGGKLVGGVADQEACFSDRTIANHHASVL